ncbi:hypothetical protein [Rhodococcus jostii]|nr:hypothetical protein [Rhodococcus jostii]
MNPSVKRAAGMLVAVAAALLAFATPAQADSPAPVYFRVGNVHCSIAPDDSVGCDLPQPVPMDFPILGEFGLPWLGPVQHVAIDVPWLPAHPTYPFGTPFTRPGGNPDIAEVATSQTMYQKTITRGGTTCLAGFMGDVTCTTKGHSFVVTVYGIHAH